MDLVLIIISYLVEISLMFLPEILAITCILYISIKSIVGLEANRRRLKMVIGIPLLIYMCFRGDALVGEIVIRGICALPEERKTKVRHIVHLDKMYWHSDGWPVFHDRRTKQFIPIVFDNRYIYSFSRESLNNIFVSRHRLYIKDTLEDKLLITVDKYRSTWGWYGRLIDDSLIYGRDCSDGYRKVRSKNYGRYKDPMSSRVFLPKKTLE